eukprot:CCRYP_002476-RA/>CCRYP_002476-RA protein AED:0.39 eAED:0.43 QI:0/-1/0/1/-1/1/1/0/149
MECHGYGIARSDYGIESGRICRGCCGRQERHTSQRSKVESSSSSMSVAQRRRMEQWALPSSQPDSYFLERLEQNTHDSRSDYARGLRNWYAHFSAKSILLVDYRDSIKSTRRIVSDSKACGCGGGRGEAVCGGVGRGGGATEGECFDGC